ncbi:MAG: hypothetical protein JEZ06_03730 [Anaerolineaceae bacterium]|nr:hypothetical protein [Anaerolineaceae bacterium]
MKRAFLISIILLVVLNSCGFSAKESTSVPSTILPTDISGTRTAVAADIFGTQTAIYTPATAIPSRTSWPELTNTPLPGPSNTPENTQTPTATLEASEIPNLLLCYQAAVSVYADWEAYLTILGTSRAHSREVEDELNRFLYERQNRVVKYVDAEIGKFDRLMIKNVDLRKVNSCEEFSGKIFSASWFIDHENPWGVGFPNRKSLILEFRLENEINKLRTALIQVYNVPKEDIDAIDDPIWQNVGTRYGVDIPE